MKILKIAMTKTVQSNYAIRSHRLVNCSHGLVIRSLELDNLIRENDLFKMDELQSERTNCLNRRNELIIRENGFSIRGNGLNSI